jgi:hypothetical protein
MSLRDVEWRISQGSIPGRSQRTFSLASASRPAVGLTQPIGTRALSLGLKCGRVVTLTLTPSSAELENELRIWAGGWLLSIQQWTFRRAISRPSEHTVSFWRESVIRGVNMNSTVDHEGASSPPDQEDVWSLWKITSISRRGGSAYYVVPRL